MRVIAVANQKGGCGKTTTTINVAACLAFLGKRVLVIDLDSQGHAGLGLGVAVEGLEQTLYDVLSPRVESPCSLIEVTVKLSPNLHLVPSDLTLSALEQELGGLLGRECRLDDAIGGLDDVYDYVLIDCAPGLGILSFNALRAADEVLVPVETSLYSLHGLARFIETVRLAEEEFGKTYAFHALITNYDARTRTARQYLGEIQELLGEITLSTIVRRNVRLSDAATAGRPITEFDRRASGFRDYMACASELIERGSIGAIAMAEDAAVSAAASDESLSPEEIAEELTASETAAEADEPRTEIASGETEPQIPVTEPEPAAIDSEADGESEQPPAETPPTPASEAIVAEAAAEQEESELPEAEVIPATASDVEPEEEDLAEVITVEEPGAPPAEAPAEEIRFPVQESAGAAGLKIPRQDEDLRSGGENAPIAEGPALEIKFQGPVQVPEGTFFAMKAPRAQTVRIAGEFNDWQPEPMERAESGPGVWQATRKLEHGSYRYKFVIDGEWINDPHNRNTMQNPFGGFDSVVTVPTS